LPSVLSNYARGKDAILERIDGLLAEIAGVPRSEQ
jgi:hypothetical protein